MEWAVDGEFASLVHDARQDFAIWQHKRYLSAPALAAGDGPIGKYRAWARQFYHLHPHTDSLE